MTIKLAIIYAGGGAAGKTTTTQAFAIGKPEQHQELMEVETRKGLQKVKVNWTVYENCAVAGNHTSGTDANVGPGATRAAFLECLKIRDVIIVDGMISTPKWVLMLNEHKNLQAICVHFNLSAEELLTRLAKRRDVCKESIREAMWDKKVGLVRRAELLVEKFETICTVDWEYLELSSEDSTDDIVELLDEVVHDVFGEYA